MLECPKCKFDNELGRIFCHQCGTKLDLDKVKPPTKGARIRRRMATGVGHWTRIIAELAVAGGMICFVVLICITPDLHSIRPTNADLIAADNKRFDLDLLVSGRKPGVIEVTEGQLNAFLYSLSFEKPKGTGVEFTPLSLRGDFENGTMTISLLGEVRFDRYFTKRIYVSMTGIPEITPHGVDLKPTAGRFGSLPIPAKLLDSTDLMQKFLGKLLSNLRYERHSLDKLTSIKIDSDRAILNYEPPAK